ncbi:MAG: response regulator [Planctomycetota bacterium]|nr:response regulator [Planctomycetota bacterium]
MQTLLVVDDSRVDRRLIGGLLLKTGEYEVIYAENGRDALKRIELDIPDAVLTDLHMPELNGLELVQAMKRDYPLIPVLLMTAQGSEELAVEALRLGAASYVTKRRLGEDLIPTIHQILEAASSSRGETRLLNRIVSSETSYVLPNDTKLIHALSQQVRDIMRSMRIFAENDRLRIGIAFEEAVLNSLYHGNLEVSSELRDKDHSAYEDLARKRTVESPYMDRQLYIDISLTRAAAKFSVRDEGPGFAPTSVSDPTVQDFLDRPSGRGMLLMKAFMDEIIYSETGNQVTMVKFAPPSDEITIDVAASVFDDDDSEDFLS